ncbi:MAG TPA: 50S ribosomal protein L11 methyltransferase [Longimicrobiales bacterium]
MARKRWLVISIRPSGQADTSALAEGLLALGGSAVHEEADALISYLPPPVDLDQWLEQARAQLGHEFEWRWQEDEDWAESWKRGLQPRRIGRHFVVAPSWTTPAPRAGDRVIIIDPEMAFGTGEHATTRGALRFLEQCITPDSRVLDVGTGSAILAIGAAKCGAEHVLAVEYDEDAIINARDNIVRNGVAEIVELQTALVDEAFLRARGAHAFDVIAANVLSGVLLPLLPSFHQALQPDGHLILGGILESEADDMIDAAQNAGFKLRAEDLEDEWWGGWFQR